MPEKPPLNRTALVLLSVLAVLLIAILAAVFLLFSQIRGVQVPVSVALPASSKPTGLPAVASIVEVAVPPIRKSDIVYGSLSAPVILYEYSDLECPFCKQFQPTLTSLETDYGDALAVVFRHYPIPSLHPGASLEAYVVACIAQADPIRARSVVDLTYRETTSSGNTYTQDQYIDLAVRAGADKSQIAGCLQNGSSKASVDQDIADGKRFGIRATPTSFLVRTKDSVTAKIEGAYEESKFRQAIDFLEP